MVGVFLFQDFNFLFSFSFFFYRSIWQIGLKLLFFLLLLVLLLFFFFVRYLQAFAIGNRDRDGKKDRKKRG